MSGGPWTWRAGSREGPLAPSPVSGGPWTGEQGAGSRGGGPSPGGGGSGEREWGGWAGSGGGGEQGAGDGGNYKVGEEPTLVRKLLLYAPPIIDAFVVG